MNVQFSMLKFQIVAFFLVLLFQPQLVYAHTLKTDGSIGAIMHVDPDDDPVAGRQSNFYFEFKDKNNAFKPTDCDCTFAILQNGKVLFSQPLFKNNADPNLSNASASYYFPEQGVYMVRVTGQSHNNQSFPPFTLNYDLRVSRTNSTPENATTGSNWFSDHLVQLTGGLVGLIILGFIIVKKGGKK
jgi:hypothetical protein